MRTITSEFSFDSAHFLPKHPGKCYNIHGHRWRVVVTIKGALNEQGMIIDFTEFKQALKLLEDRFDHKLVITKGSLQGEFIEQLEKMNFAFQMVHFDTTAENMSMYFFEQLKMLGYEPVLVEVYETPNNKASYSEV